MNFVAFKDETSCGFCGKTEEEVPLIEIASNSLVIGKNHFEFSHIFQELLGITQEDIQSLAFICDVCKDSAVQFFIFKSNVALVSNSNPHRKMILEAVESFLKQTSNLEEIQVVRKLHSITLQIDQDVTNNVATVESDYSKQLEDEQEYEEVFSEFEPKDDEETAEDVDLPTSKDEEVIEVVSECSQCSKCNEILTSADRSETHEFFKHSLLGALIENEAENCQELTENDQRKCENCGTEFEDSTTFAHHLVVEHSQDFLKEVNQLYCIDETSLDLPTIMKYILHVQELICKRDEEETKVDEKIKQYFYEIYSGDGIKTSEQIEEIEDEIFSDAPYEELTEAVTFKPSKPVKSSVSLSSLDDENRDWVKNEINTRKKLIKNEFGIERVIYRCAYCNVYSSNSAPGFRYHLISKHLKGNSIRELREIHTELAAPPVKSRIGRNICEECNLKFKDQKMLSSHQNCHELFDTISQYYCFPACHTCNSLYIDDSSLNLHLNKHEENENIAQSIQVPIGAVILQGKRASVTSSNQENEIPSKEFSWSCGHCSKRFKKESSCRFHILMVHSSIFTCPMDKREFSGHKAVSLFCHHLKNKHPEIFPDLVFPCTFCNMEFSSIYDKLFHMKSCSEKKFECDHCQKKFFKKGDLMSHLKFISGELFFQCKMCDKKCETLSDLKIHIRSHTKEKPFSCAICSKSFRTLAARSAHTESHNTNVLYSCHCGKSFKQRQSFRRHMKAFHETSSKDENTQSKLEPLVEESQ